jgi:hypothetical protein
MDPWEFLGARLRLLVAGCKAAGSCSGSFQLLLGFVLLLAYIFIRPPPPSLPPPSASSSFFYNPSTLPTVDILRGAALVSSNFPRPCPLILETTAAKLFSCQSHNVSVLTLPPVQLLQLRRSLPPRWLVGSPCWPSWSLSCSLLCMSSLSPRSSAWTSRSIQHLPQLEAMLSAVALAKPSTPTSTMPKATCSTW